MNLDQLKEEARNDLVITNQEDLASESLTNQKIKSKYLDHRSKFQLLLQKHNGDYQRLYRQKWEYYGGKADAKVYATKPFDLKVLKTIDLNKLDPKLLMIEASNLDFSERDKIISYLKLNNYKILYDNKVNVIFSK